MAVPFDEELAMQGAINTEAERQAAQEAQQSADGKDMVNNASMAGISQAGRQHQQAQMQAQQAQLRNLLGPIVEPMNGVQRQMAQQRMKLSELYNQFDDAANKAMSDGDESSANELIGYRDGVAAQAQAFDKQLQMAGIGLPDAYRANVPLALQQMAFAADSMAGLDRILNKNMSSDEFYNKEYKRLRMAGYSDRRANALAAEKAGEYRLERLAKLNDAFNSYGISDGGMNPAGVRMLQAMAQEDAGQANVLGNMYASPKTVQDQVIKQALKRAEIDAQNLRAMQNNQTRLQTVAMNNATRERGQNMTRENIGLASQYRMQELHNKAAAAADIVEKMGGSSQDQANAYLKVLGAGGTGAGATNSYQGRRLDAAERKAQIKYYEDWLKDFEAKHSDMKQEELMQDPDYAEVTKSLDRLRRDIPDRDLSQWPQFYAEAVELINTGKYTDQEMINYLRSKNAPEEFIQKAIKETFTKAK